MNGSRGTLRLQVNVKCLPEVLFSLFVTYVGFYSTLSCQACCNAAQLLMGDCNWRHKNHKAESISRYIEYSVGHPSDCFDGGGFSNGAE